MSAALDGAAQILVPTNLLAVLALGFALGQNAVRLPLINLAVFAAGLLIGSVLIAMGTGEMPIPVTLLALAAGAAIMVVIARPIPPMMKAALSFATGAALALNAPPQTVTFPAAIAAQCGTAMAAFAMLGLVVLVAARANRGWQDVGLRIVGSWIAASAILVLALRLAR